MSEKKIIKEVKINKKKKHKNKIYSCANSVKIVTYYFNHVYYNIKIYISANK